jgi:3-oxoacyl-[acyl-carrier protein] reductase
MTSKNVAVVTGGGRGIGKGICCELAKAGWVVLVNFHTNAQAASDTRQEIDNLGGIGYTFQADISSGEARIRLLQYVIDELGHANLLVNNAGVAPKQRNDMLDLTEESFDEVLATNLRGPFFLTQLFARQMMHDIEQGKISEPKIINIGSISATTSSTNRAEYCISKAGLGMTTELWASRLAEYGINVFELRPGIIDTDMTAAVRTKYDRLILEEGLTPIRRWGQPEDVGKAVRAIAEGSFPFSTGEVIYIDGGFHILRL